MWIKYKTKYYLQVVQWTIHTPIYIHIGVYMHLIIWSNYFIQCSWHPNPLITNNKWKQQKILLLRFKHNYLGHQQEHHVTYKNWKWRSFFPTTQSTNTHLLLTKYLHDKIYFRSKLKNLTIKLFKNIYKANIKHFQLQ